MVISLSVYHPVTETVSVGVCTEGGMFFLVIISHYVCLKHINKIFWLLSRYLPS